MNYLYYIDIYLLKGYLGCYDNNPRILENAHTYSLGMVTESCAARCISGGYLYALIEVMYVLQSLNEHV
jgi:hypothetical protein